MVHSNRLVNTNRSYFEHFFDKTSPNEAKHVCWIFVTLAVSLTVFRDRVTLLAVEVASRGGASTSEASANAEKNFFTTCHAHSMMMGNDCQQKKVFLEGAWSGVTPDPAPSSF
jgi:hypothetical protein